MVIKSQDGQNEIEISPKTNSVFMKYSGQGEPWKGTFDVSRTLDWVDLTPDQQDRLQLIVAKAEALMRDAVGVLL